MIKGEQNYIYKLKEPFTLSEMVFKKGQEFNIINQVVYMEGFPLPLGLQRQVFNWIMGNKNLFMILNREY